MKKEDRNGCLYLFLITFTLWVAIIATYLLR